MKHPLTILISGPKWPSQKLTKSTVAKMPHFSILLQQLSRNSMLFKSKKHHGHTGPRQVGPEWPSKQKFKKLIGHFGPSKLFVDQTSDKQVGRFGPSKLFVHQNPESCLVALVKEAILVYRGRKPALDQCGYAAFWT